MSFKCRAKFDFLNEKFPLLQEYQPPEQSRKKPPGSRQLDVFFFLISIDNIASFPPVSYVNLFVT